jgi:CxxC-x17-CxxC domain-containing protein
MKNFDNTYNNRGRDPQKRRFNDRDRERPQMFDAICSDCGRKCQVPFKPSNDKPIYCSECFENHGGGSSNERRERPRFQDKRMFDATCGTCGKRFELPFRPTRDKPVYCNECFDRGGSSPSKTSDRPVNQYKEQFDMLNSKLDKILKALTPVIPVKEEILIEKKKKTRKVIVKKKKTKK